MFIFISQGMVIKNLKKATHLKITISIVGVIIKRWTSPGSVTDLPEREPQLIFSPHTEMGVVREAKNPQGLVNCKKK